MRLPRVPVHYFNFFKSIFLHPSPESGESLACFRRCDTLARRLLNILALPGGPYRDSRLHKWIRLTVSTGANKNETTYRCRKTLLGNVKLYDHIDRLEPARKGESENTKINVSQSRATLWFGTSSS